VAPPGFGKTTLLGQWHRADERPFAWVSLDAGDNNPVLLWTYITWALRSRRPGPRAEMEALAKPAAEDIERTVIPRLLEELEAIDDEIVLVLDDCHWITDPASVASLGLFLDRRPPGLTVVLSARADPFVPLGRLRVQDDLLELRATDLSFTLAEARRFLTETLGLALSPDAVRDLWQRTEGWPAGLYLAYLSLRDIEERDEFIARFRGSSRHIVDYLTEVIVDALDERTRSFLLQTSIVERMCAPLCDVIVGGSGSAAVLESVEHANLFLVPLDTSRTWYRYHRLFAELLRDELQRRHPELVPELHRRASRWFADEGLTTEAIRHAITGKDLETAAALVSGNYLLTLEWGGVATVMSWLEAFPRQAVTTDARLSVVQSWVMSFLNRYDESDHAMRRAFRAGFDGPLPDGASSLEASAALVRAASPRGDVAAMLAAARKAYELDGDSDSMWHVTTHVQLGWSLLLTGAFEDARPFLERGASLAPSSEQWLNSFGARSLLAWVALESGRLPEAELHAREAIAIVDAHDLPESAAAWGRASLGAVLARTGAIEEADALLSPAVELMRTGAPVLMLVQALLALVPVRWARGAHEEARDLLDEARHLVAGCDDPGYLGDRLQHVIRTLVPGYRRIDGSTELTERELEVLRHLDKGLSKREVAHALYLSYNTIHSHTKSIYRKLGAFSRSEAVRRAHEEGVL
jgi:LuxR family transcriptional regulator, maltose regulon positive regulatory protein